MILISQALQSFSSALASGQLGPLMRQFELDDSAVTAAQNGGVFCCYANRRVSYRNLFCKDDSSKTSTAVTVGHTMYRILVTAALCIFVIVVVV